MALYEEAYERAKEARRAAEKRVVDDVKCQLLATLRTALSGVGRKQIELILVTKLHCFVLQDVIKNFNIEVDLIPGRRIKQVDCLPIMAAPGDALIKTEPGAEPGEVKERYEGIVVSSDGAGNGVVFQQNPSSEVYVKCRLQLTPWPEYTLLEIRHEI